ncbi:hypothetical protein DID78_04460 [Candidatus Marinamargulisbacteria bacterium SCGC AG-343-D04]|nr:hypothetical protein DID78_04460 [Candidatus Marinamargulisbacteria bacterium SCGC AG-343-D04]
MIDYYKTTVGLLRKENLVWVPFIVFYILYDVIALYRYSGQEGMFQLDFLFMFQHIVQYLVYGGLVFLVHELTKDVVSLRSAFNSFKESVFSLFLCSLFGNFLLLLLYFLFSNGYNVFGSEDVALEGMPLVQLIALPFLMYSLVPVQAILNTIFIFKVVKNMTAWESFVCSFKSCFSHFFVCLRWFLYIMPVFFVQLLFLPIITSDLLVKHLLMSVLNGCAFTFITVFSYVYFKDNFMESRDLVKVPDH